MGKYIVIIVLLLSCISSCKDDNREIEINKLDDEFETTKLSSNRPSLNISILVDLSDRINPKKYPMPAMEFYQRDLGYINSIAKSFELHLRNKQSIKINDNLQLYIDPEPSDKNLNEKVDRLKMTFTKDNAKKARILQTSIVYDSISELIYSAAIHDNKYIGSDIWRFFKTKVKDFCLEDNYRNILIILTDGYIYHKDSKRKKENSTTYLTAQDIRNFKLNTNDWETRFTEKKYGFIPATDGLENLEILVLGINPDKKNAYEEDVIMKYWSDWFKTMNVTRFELKTAGLPSDMDKIIKRFILGE